MSTNIIMKIEKIPGESVVKGYENQIDIMSYQFGGRGEWATTSFMSGVSGPGKGEIEFLTLSKRWDKSSAGLYAHMLDGSHIPEVTITSLGQVNGDNVVIYSIVMKDVRIQQASTSCGSGEAGESIVLAFKKIDCTYTQYDDKGTSKGTTSFGFAIDTVETSTK